MILRLLLAFLLRQSLVNRAVAFEACEGDAGRGFCPNGNTCCVISAEGNQTTPGCIPNDLGSFNATCCHDSAGTGCAVGYYCVENDLCLAGSSIQDPLVQVLPRYKLGLAQVHPTLYGLPVLENNSDYKFVYYSSHGDLRELAQSDLFSSVRMILIVLHGSGRNADDYFCSSTAAVAQQGYVPPEGVVLITPRFPSLQDGDLEIVNGGTAIRWDDGGDVSGTWRYGEEATLPSDIDESLSSFRAIDLLLDAINVTQLPLLQKVVIVGHSSGGQFVQRWALMTPHWTDSLYRGIVANPSSYAYLTPKRFVDGQWKLPSDASCPNYNQWEHGLDPGGNCSVSYVRDVVDELGVDTLVRRYRSRRMTYLIGSLDVCPIAGDESGWCNSHGLEITCADMLQGRTRLERHEHFVKSLQTLEVPYTRYIIPGVHHDHSLMFNSPEGLRAMFEPLPFDEMAAAQ
jgi:pimeloyl-ACP methyl ester carboxylesterase